MVGAMGRAPHALKDLLDEPWLVERLADRGLRSAPGVLVNSAFELMEILDLPLDAVRRILAHVSNAVTPRPVQVRAVVLL